MRKQYFLFLVAFLFATLGVNAQRRTSLVPASNNAVNWSVGDAFNMLSYTKASNSKDVLIAKVTTKSSGLGIATDQSSSTVCYIKYDGIKITTADGTDITSTITSASTAGNSYKVGGYTGSGSTSAYAYVTAGTSLQLEASTNINSNYTIPIIQASSSSSVATTNIYVQLKGLQWSLDGNTWTAINSSSTLVNGSSWGKTSINYTWASNIVTDPTSLTYDTSYSPDESEISTSSNTKYTIATDAGSSTADFSGDALTDGATYYGIYPYSASNTYDGTNITFNLPSAQTYTAGSFYNNQNPQVGAYTSTGIDFKNVCGIFELQLKGTETITSISLKDNADANLCGTATVAASTIGTDNGIATVTNGSPTITLNCGAGVTLTDTPTSFYFILPVGTLTKGFTATITANEGVATLSSDKAQTIKRSVIKKMTACTLGELKLEELNIENKTVQDMMAHSYSTFTSGSSSYLDNSTFTSNRSSALTSTNPYRNDQPNTKTITFSNDDAATVTVTMATDNSYINTVLNTTTTASTYTLCNMVPGNTYYYKVTDSNNATLTSGAFRATGQLRMIKIDDSWNLRDLGGWTGWNGNKVLYEKIYRGGSLGGTSDSKTTGTYVISGDSKAELYRIGLRAHLDLRATVEGGGAWSSGGSANGFSLGYTPLLTGTDFQNICTDWALYYAKGSSAAVGDLAFIIKEIEAGKPVYFHCRTGADRTGVVGMTVLGLLGCDAFTANSANGNQIAMDYEFTSLGMDEEGTIAYNTSGTLPSSYSNRYANGIQSSGYNYFRTVYGLSTTATYKDENNKDTEITLSTFQDRIYYYLNRYFYDHSVSAAGAVYINKTDLDKFINIMLEITDKDGKLINGHTESDMFTGPSWAKDYDNNTLDTVISTASEKQYTYTSN